MPSIKDRLARAERALLRAGFTDCGGEEWKPPLGPTVLKDSEALTKLQAEHAANVVELMSQSNRNRSLEDILLRHGFETDGTNWRNNAALLDVLELRRQLAVSQQSLKEEKAHSAAKTAELTKVYRKLTKLIGKASFDFTENEYGD